MKDIKKVILNRIIEETETQIRTAESGRLDAIKESKAHKGAMASRYDTFKEEAQYLARGLNLQVTDLHRTLAALKSVGEYPSSITKVSGFSIVEVESLDSGSRTNYFLLPAGGGNEYEIEEKIIKVLSVGSPVARALLGAVVGDTVEVKIQETTKKFLVVSLT